MLLPFLASKTNEIHVNTSITVKVLGGISFHIMAANMKHQKDTHAFPMFFFVLQSKQILAYSDLLPNISLAVGQSSVNISLHFTLVIYPLND